MQSQHELISVHTQLQFDECVSVLRDFIMQSGMEIVSELPVHREVQRKLGLRFFKYTVFTVWDPLLTYQALTAMRESPYFGPFNIAVCQEGAWSAVLTPRLPDPWSDTSRVGTSLIAHTAQKKISRIVARVAAIRLPLRDRRENHGSSAWLHRRFQSVLRFVSGGAR